MTKYVCKICGYIYDPAEGDPDNGVAAGYRVRGPAGGLGMPAVRGRQG